MRNRSNYVVGTTAHQLVMLLLLAAASIGTVASKFVLVELSPESEPTNATDGGAKRLPVKGNER